MARSMLRFFCDEPYQWQKPATVALRASDCRFLVFIGAHDGVLEAMDGLYVLKQLAP